MLDHIGIALMMERIHGSRDRRPGAAEDEFYQSVGDSRLVHIAARLLSMPIAKGAFGWRGAFWLSEANRPIRPRSACDPALPPERHRCGIA
ncbi:hypothetical protein ASC97_01035 [Rhizobium sp. Root1203]|nr:hypothetical protein ASC97_01035 [Rhizobium sp. Root1203]